MFELDGRNLYGAFASGAVTVIDRQDYLNRINVFPVPDGDTGTNLAATLHSMAQALETPHDAGSTISAMADAALLGARGNSGMIFAQFLSGFREKVSSLKTIGIDHFIQAVEHAAQRARASISSPREGTILSVIHDWALALKRERPNCDSFRELFRRTIPDAEASLERTPEQLDVLKRAGVVDAGALGFVEFLKGAGSFVETGRDVRLAGGSNWKPGSQHAVENADIDLTYRYCVEALLRGRGIDTEAIREVISEAGDSLIVAGSAEMARVHIHTGDPAGLFDRLRQFGSPTMQKVDDMRKQVEVVRSRKWPIALVTDSSCDLPQELLDCYQIHVVPLLLNFGEAEYLDRVTLTTSRFFELADRSPLFPKTSQPAAPTFERLYSFLSSYYESIIAIHLSSKLSGTCEASRREALRFEETRISVIDSRHLSGSLGLLVLRAAKLIERGAAHEEVVKEIEEAREKAEIFVGVRTLRYMVRGGRVSPVLGAVGRALNLKPIVSLDREGKSILYGRAFSMRANAKRIVSMVKATSRRGRIASWAVVHGVAPAAASDLAQRIESVLGISPEFVMEISPVVGLNAGRGTVAAVLTLE